MKLIQKGKDYSHRGVIGIESAIVLIAFVIVAAALAFVVLNAGFTTTQQAKTTVGKSIGEAASSLEVSGKIIGIGCTAAGTCAVTPVLNATGAPIKITAGGDSVNLDPAQTAVKYLSGSVEYDNIYAGTINQTLPNSLSSAMDDAVTVTYIDSNPVTSAATSSTVAFIYWTKTTTPQNSVLDPGEHATIAITFRSVDRPGVGDKMRTELIVSSGATLTTERTVPNITNLVNDLG